MHTPGGSSPRADLSGDGRGVRPPASPSPIFKFKLPLAARIGDRDAQARAPPFPSPICRVSGTGTLPAPVPDSHRAPGGPRPGHGLTGSARATLNGTLTLQVVYKRILTEWRVVNGGTE
jgi:hypothetical protein